MVAVASGCALLAGCSSRSSSNPGTIVTPTPTPTATPTPTPSPTPTYATYAALTGNQSFRTACASLTFNGNPPVLGPATAFGDGPTLAYTAASDSYAITGDGQMLSYGPVDRDTAAPATVRSYTKTVDGFVQRFTIGQPVAGGAALDYMRGFSLRAQRFGSAIQYACIFGVPTLATDLPATAFSYARTGINGVAYGNDNGALRTYSLEASTMTLAFDPVARTVTTSITLVGTLQTAGGPGATVPLGTYAGTASIDTAKGSFYGNITSTNRDNVFAQFGGWFFGPQAREAGYAAGIYGRDPATGLLIAATVNGSAIR